MPVLKNPKHEQFCVAYGKSGKAEESYISAYGPSKGADASGRRLLRNALIRARVSEVMAEITGGMIQLEISHREARLRMQQERWIRMRLLIDARAADPETLKAPGGNTGLLVHSQRMFGSGPTAKLVNEYELDGALLREMREIEKQAAIEMGQWNEDRESDKGRKLVLYEDLEKLVKEHEAATGGAPK